MNFEIDFCRLKIQFVELDSYNLIFQKSSTDQVNVVSNQKRVIQAGEGTVNMVFAWWFCLKNGKLMQKCVCVPWTFT